MNPEITDRFTLTDQHLHLLRNSYVSWINLEAGAAGIDPKRPYGNSSVAEDLARLLDWPRQECPHCGGDASLTDERQQELFRLHRGTRIALQIVLCTGCFKPGDYACYNHDQRSWEKVG